MTRIKTIRTDKAQRTSFSAHYGQKDKSGKAYFMHPLEVASSMISESAAIVAYLHDVFEDTALRIQDVGYLGEAERVALHLITKKSGQDYNEYIMAIKENQLARAVKIADIKHNLKNRGWKPPPELVAKYEKALRILTDD